MPSTAASAADAAACEDSGVTTYATLHTNHGDIGIQLSSRPRAQDGAQLRRAGRGHQGVDRPDDRQPAQRAALRRHGLPPGHRRLHDPGRRPARHRHRRPGLHVQGRVPPRAAPSTSPTCSRWPTPARAPTARSSSSPSAPTPWLNRKHTIFGEVADAGSRARRRRDRHARRPARGDRPVEPVVIESRRVERAEHSTARTRGRRRRDDRRRRSDLLPAPGPGDLRPLPALRAADLPRLHAHGVGRLPVPGLRARGHGDGPRGPHASSAGRCASARIVTLALIGLNVVVFLLAAASAGRVSGSAELRAARLRLCPAGRARRVVPAGHLDVPARRDPAHRVQHVRALRASARRWRRCSAVARSRVLYLLAGLGGSVLRLYFWRLPGASRGASGRDLRPLRRLLRRRCADELETGGSLGLIVINLVIVFTFGRSTGGPPRRADHRRGRGRGLRLRARAGPSRDRCKPRVRGGRLVLRPPAASGLVARASREQLHEQRRLRPAWTAVPARARRAADYRSERRSVWSSLSSNRSRRDPRRPAMRDAVIVDAVRTPVGKRNGRAGRRAPGRPLRARAARARRAHRASTRRWSTT